MMTLYQVQPCVECGGETIRTFTELTYEFERVRIIVRDVPVATCTRCGEQYVPGEFGVWLGSEVARLAEQIASTLETDELLEATQVETNVSRRWLEASGTNLAWTTA
jgi:YgiT-type zinc finger domain-containing protein